MGAGWRGKVSRGLVGALGYSFGKTYDKGRNYERRRRRRRKEREEKKKKKKGKRRKRRKK